MSYWLLRQDARPEHWTAMLVAGALLEPLGAGAPIEKVEEPVRVTLSAWGQQPSDFLERPAFVVSDAMRKALDRAGVDNIQYFKAELRMQYADEEPIKGYWLGNVIGTVACVDEDASTFEESSGGESRALRAFQVDPARASGLSLFRLAEDRRVVVVSARIRAVLQAARLEGLLFQDPRTYDGYPASSAPSEPRAQIADAELSMEDDDDDLS